MCTGASFALYAAFASAAVGTAVTVVQGQQQKKQANAQAQQAINSAAYDQDAAKAQAEKIRRAGRAQLGQTTAALAKSGVNLSEGTPLELKKSVIQDSEQDALSTILSGDRSASSQREEAKLLGKAGKNAQTNSYFSAASSALSAYGSSGKASGWRG